MKQQVQGYLLLAVVILIALMSAVIAGALAISGLTSAAQAGRLQSSQAFYIAEAGLARAQQLFGAGSTTCSAISGATALTDISFAQGAFTVTSASSGSFATTTLISAISSSGTIAMIASSTGFANSGQARIGAEIVNYQGISSSVSVCGTIGTCLYGLRRGTLNTMATAHIINAPVTQYQCQLISTGGVPNLTDPEGLRAVTQTWGPISAFWAVGNRSGNDFYAAQYNAISAQGQWQAATVTGTSQTRADLYDLSLVSAGFGFAVGQSNSLNGFTVLMLSPTTGTWQTVLGLPVLLPTFVTNLNGVSTVSEREAWTVGDRSGNVGGGHRRYTVLRYLDGGWCALQATQQLGACAQAIVPTDNKQNQKLNAVHVLDVNADLLGDIGFAVGDAGDMLQYTGSTQTWTKLNAVTGNNLNDIVIVPPATGSQTVRQAWAVGASGTLLRFDGSTWQTESSPTNTQFQAVDVLDSDHDGLADLVWVVGNNGTTIYAVRSGGNYTFQTVATSTGRDLYDVKIVGQNDVWCVGKNGTSLHWNGQSWASVSTGTTNDLNALDATVPPGVSALGNWQEVFA